MCKNSHIVRSCHFLDFRFCSLSFSVLLLRCKLWIENKNFSFNTDMLMKSVEAVYSMLCNDAKFKVVFMLKHDFHHLYTLFLKCQPFNSFT